MENFLISLAYLSIGGIIVVYIIWSITEYGDVHIAITLLAEEYGIRKQKWWERGADYEKYVKEEMVRIEKRRLLNRKHFE